MERYEVKASELHLAFDPEQEGLTTVYLASEVDARIAELEMQLAEAKGHIETLDRSNNRLRQKIDRLSS